MRYRVYLEHHDGHFYLDVNGVADIGQDEYAYFLYDEDDTVLFSAPLDKVIAIQRI